MGDLLNKIDSFLNIEEYEESDFDEMLESLIDFVSLIDLDSLNEEQIEQIDKIIDLMEEDEILSERTERVVRQGKRVRRKICRAGYKVQDGKCVKISASEKRHRSKSAKRAAKKKRGQKSIIARKRARSMKKRGA